MILECNQNGENIDIITFTGGVPVGKMIAAKAAFKRQALELGGNDPLIICNDLSDDEFLKIAASHVEALNHALQDVPAEKVRVHICWGNYEGPHVCDIPMSKMFDTLMSTKSRYVLFETSNPRHGHEWSVFRDRKADIPEDKVLVPGVVDTTTNFVEHPELVAERVSRFVDIVGADRVIAGSDCGFGTFAGFGAVDPDIAYAKLGSLAKGAALAG